MKTFVIRCGAGALVAAALASCAMEPGGLVDSVASVQCPASIPPWAADTAYAVGAFVRYGGSVYRCVQAHTSLANWTPDAVPALWQAVQCADGGSGGSSGAGGAGGSSGGAGGSSGGAGGSAGTGGTGGATASDTYYVALDGSDSNSGRDLAHPFRTIGKAAAVAVAGDSVAIRGGVYRESVRVAHSGSAAQPITFHSYPGETATISGADLVPASAWTVFKGHLYRAPQAWSLGAGADQLFLDGRMMNEARWPNTALDASHPVPAIVDSVTVPDPTNAVVTLNDAALTQPADTFNGAHLTMGVGKVWIHKTYTVTSNAVGQIVFSAGNITNANYAPTAGNPYYIWGTLAALDTGGEWFVDAAAQQLYLWPPAGDSPAQHVVEAKRRATAFDFNSQSFVVLRAVRIFAATVSMDASSHDDTIDGIAARYVSQAAVLSGSFSAHATDTGLLIRGARQRVLNSAISWSSGSGVMLAASDSTIANCLIHDVAYAASNAAGIYATGATGATVEHNTVYNTGRSGIILGFANSKIRYNEVRANGLQTQDLGCLYVAGKDGMQSEIAFNVLHGVNPAYYHKIGAGVYLDQKSSNWIVHHNLVYDTTRGVILNAPTNELLYDNTFVGNVSGNGPASGVQSINNIVVGTFSQATSVQHNDLVAPTDPQFVDALHGDYQLDPGSPAVDKGQALPPYTDGYVGTAPDIGAFERGRPAWTAGSTLTSDGF